jgi:hypothetical protein
LWVIFAFLDPDPDSESGSGSTDPIESGSNPDPDLDPIRMRIRNPEKYKKFFDVDPDLYLSISKSFYSLCGRKSRDNCNKN